MLPSHLLQSTTSQHALIIGQDPIIFPELISQLQQLQIHTYQLQQSVNTPHKDLPLHHPDNHYHYIFHLESLAADFNMHLTDPQQQKQRHQTILQIAHHNPQAKWNIVSLPLYLHNRTIYQDQLNDHLANALQQLRSDYRISHVYDCIPSQPTPFKNPPSPLYTILNLLHQKKLPSTHTTSRFFPISSNHTVQGLIKATLQPSTSAKEFLFLPKDSISATTITERFNQLFPGLRQKKLPRHRYTIGFPPDLNQAERTRKQLNWNPESDFTTLFNPYLSHLGLKSLPLKQFSVAKSQTLKTLRFQTPKTIMYLRNLRWQIHHRKPSFHLFTSTAKIAITLAIIALIPFISHLIYLIQSSLTLAQSAQQLKQGNFHQAQVLANKSQQHVQFASYPRFKGETTYRQIFRPLYQLTDQPRLILNHSSKFVSSLTRVGELTDALINQALDAQETQNPTPLDISSTQLELAKASQESAIIASQLAKPLPSYLSWAIPSETQQLIQNLAPQLPEALQISNQLLPLYPHLTGVYESQTYLVLFQNSNELRPTGGFIGSFALVNLEHGTLKDWQIHDVYQADGQLRGYVAPPDPIKNYLNEPSWYLRDANWDPDFPSSSQTIQWFLQKELNTTVDGVIAVDTHVLSKILETTGPITVPEFTQPITGQNVTNYLQQRIEADFFPGSHTKRTSLSLLAQNLLQTIKRQNLVQQAQVLSQLKQLTDQKHILISLNNPQLQSTINQLGWSGGVTIPSYPIGQVTDLLGIFEANVGVNKVNQFIDRQIAYSRFLDKSSSTNSKLKVTYTNNSHTEDKTQGTYRNYIQLYLPPHAIPREITTNHRSLSTADLKPQTKAYDLSYLDIQPTDNYTKIGFYLEIPPQTTTELLADFTLPTDLQAQSYTLHLLKQPGTTNTPVTIDISSSRHNFDTINNPHLFNLTEPHHLTYNTNLLTDQVIEIEFE